MDLLLRILVGILIAAVIVWLGSYFLPSFVAGIIAFIAFLLVVFYWSDVGDRRIARRR